MRYSSEDKPTKEGFAEGWRAGAVELAISYAVNHPIRLGCFLILITRVASPSEIARELGISVTTAARHVNELYKDGVVEFVTSETGGSRRGGIENFYRAVSPPSEEVTDEDWKFMPKDTRRQMASRVLQVIIAQSLAALGGRTMEIDRQLHLGWQAIEVDEEGEDEVAEVLAQANERFKLVKGQNKKRLKRSADAGKVRIVATLGFYRADPGEWPGRPDPL